MYDIYQVVEARAWGADCILIIMAAVDDYVAQDLEDTASAFGMDVLLEVHDETELERALRRRIALIGINNRDLQDVRHVASRPASGWRPGFPRTASSSAKAEFPGAPISHGSPRAGISTFLVGESLMREPDVEAATRRCSMAAAACVPGRRRPWRAQDAHPSRQGGDARMVDVSAKPATERIAVAEGRVVMTRRPSTSCSRATPRRATCSAPRASPASWRRRRRIELIPLCHPLAISKIAIDIAPDASRRACWCARR